jgi:hypothetical protein
MRSILILGILITGTFSEYIHTSVNRTHERNNTFIDTQKIYYINGEIFNFTRYSSHLRVVIEDEKLGRITLRLNNDYKIKNKNKVNGYCTKYDFGEYQECYVSII